MAQKEALPGKRRPIEFVAITMPMPLRKRHEQPLLPEGRDLASRPRLLAGNEGHVEIQPGDGSLMFGSLVLDKVDMNASVMLIVGTEQLGQEPRCERRQDADGDPAVFRSPDGGDIVCAVPHVPKHVLGLPPESPHAPIVALEQRGAELIFQIADTAADRGFLHAKRNPGLAEAALLSGGYEVAQVAKLYGQRMLRHAALFRYRNWP